MNLSKTYNKLNFYGRLVMFYEYQIATMPECNYIINEFNQKFKWLEQKGIAFQVKDFKLNHFSKSYYLKLDVQDFGDVFTPEDIVYIFKHHISEVLTEHIINDWEGKLLWKEVGRTCKNNTNKEKEAIYSKASEFLRQCNDSESLNLLMNFSRKNKIHQRLLKHINDSEMIIIEGFINFCLPDYLKEISIAVDLATEELKSEQEYNEFVKLLRYFVDTQVPKSKEVNLLLANSGIFYLWDENGDVIEDQHMDYYLDDILFDDINLDDILISILITIAPRRIILHNIIGQLKNEAVEVIRKVFKDKISLCVGCEKCLEYLQGQHNEN